MSTKTKFQKKKDREKEVKRKVLARRTAARAAAKIEREKENESRRIQRVANRLEGKTVRNQKTGDNKIIDQLSHNLEILEALQKEQEMLDESQKNTPQLNTEGVPGVPKGQGGKLSASADVVFIPNPVSNKEEEVGDERPSDDNQQSPN